MKKENLIKQKFNRLTVINYGNKKGYWLCECDCGSIKEIREDHLRSGATKSCGCLSREVFSKIGKKQALVLKEKNKTQKGLSHTKLYREWYGIKSRCYNENHFKYKWYGARGIKVCDEWKNNFINFYNWAINNGFDDNKSWKECTIERIDNDGNYEPSNCKWISLSTQGKNTRRNVYITYKGETHNINEWSEILKIDRHKVKKVLCND